MENLFICMYANTNISNYKQINFISTRNQSAINKKYNKIRQLFYNIFIINIKANSKKSYFCG